jgi:hypothetical protein
VGHDAEVAIVLDVGRAGHDFGLQKRRSGRKDDGAGDLAQIARARKRWCGEAPYIGAYQR